jgi:hypothetical protein
MTRYIAVIFDVGEEDVIASSIIEAARGFARVYDDEAILEIRRADYRDRTDES